MFHRVVIALANLWIYVSHIRVIAVHVLNTGQIPNQPVRQITLRQLQDGAASVHGPDAGWMRSEACLWLDFGPGRLPGLLALGAEDPHQFTPQQGTDLLSFFAGVFERSMRHWLS